jgi:hypothetical protein
MAGETGRNGPFVIEKQSHYWAGIRTFARLLEEHAGKRPNLWFHCLLVDEPEDGYTDCSRNGIGATSQEWDQASQIRLVHAKVVKLPCSLQPALEEHQDSFWPRWHKARHIFSLERCESCVSPL